ncbi:hypothetical protein HYPSUDRAFT_198529 [Hypholoma sublateritium FD-334 SS-4]|uniref:Uncharacterized protein n=1 Tax=Hypholoma sublateritium (strain FD-334 SS-4) TaxID=945553 RepID=A0A0D2MRX6_HYPSF|nr:hypothetical protein HYPSUDRAFT_198529 [Hypholoma sublateritium FD-334 SS-4]
MPPNPGRLTRPPHYWAHEITLPLKLIQWANFLYPRPQIDPEWLAECYHDFRLRLGGCDMLDYQELMLFTEEQILRSNLAHSAVDGTGVGPVNLRAAGCLQGPPLLVQVVAVTEVIRPNKPRIHKLKLSDGESIINAVAFGASVNDNIGFYNLQLGYKVGQIHLPPGPHHMQTQGIDAAQMPAYTEWRDYFAGTDDYITGWKVQPHGEEDHLAYPM